MEGRDSEAEMPADFAGIAGWRDAVAARPAVNGCARSDDWYADNYRRYLAA